MEDYKNHLMTEKRRIMTIYIDFMPSFNAPDSLAEVLYKPLLKIEIKMTCLVFGQSRSAPKGVWVQGGGIEIPCLQ